jgi:uncharacterized membrane protein (DUF4010 family)
LGGLIGGLAQAAGGIGTAAGALVVGFALVVYASVVTVFCLDENRADKTFSATTAIAAITTFVLGTYALAGDVRTAGAVAVAVAGILALRETLHGWVEKITWPELRSGLVLMAMSFVVLPILPDDLVGPQGGINPREVWLIAIVLAIVSFLGYAAVKYYGPRRGVLLAGVAGGLASSTAVTVTNARRAVAHAAAQGLLAAGVALANMVMFFRVLAIVAVLKPSLLPLVGPSLIAAAAVAFVFALIIARLESSAPADEIQFRNPFEFWSVVGFAFMLAAIMIGSRVVAETFGAEGAILTAAAVGVADADAIAVSMARLVPESLGAREAAIAILAAVSANTIGKVWIGAELSRGRFAANIGVMAVACHAAGALALWLVLC